jgi:hypothetical protein
MFATSCFLSFLDFSWRSLLAQSNLIRLSNSVLLCFDATREDFAALLKSLDAMYCDTMEQHRRVACVAKSELISFVGTISFWYCLCVFFFFFFVLFI